MTKNNIIFSEKEIMKIASREALLGIRKKDGGPFGAVIVRKNKIIAKAHNQVIKNQDPTCHAEMQVIKKAAKKIGKFDLSKCEIYSNCEPCPMCLGAIHWAKMKKLYYGVTRKDAKKLGFDDQFIYDAISGKVKHQQVIKKNIEREISSKAFKKINKNKKLSY